MVFTIMKRIEKRLKNLILGLGSMTKVLKWTLKDLFHFSEVQKSQKMNYPIDNTVHFYPYKTFKKAINLPKTFKIDFYKLYKGCF